MRKIRNCLYPQEWPHKERAALEKAIARRGLFETSPAAFWSPDFLDRRVRGYGTFLHFADQIGELKPGTSAAARASGPLLAKFVHHRAGGVSPETMAIDFKCMVAILRVIDPRGDRSQLEALARHYERAASRAREKRAFPVGISDIYEAGLKVMIHRKEASTRDRRAALDYGDGLMMAMSAVGLVRLKNLVATRVGIHLIKKSGLYEWRFEPYETKNRQVIRKELPAELTPLVDHWLQHVRPFLLKARKHDSIWVTTNGAPMARGTVYGRFCNVTERELGVRINPHAVRHIAATSIAVSIPEDVHLIPFILGHGDDRTGKDHYNLADQLSASLRYLKRLRQRRQLARARSRPGRR